MQNLAVVTTFCGAALAVIGALQVFSSHHNAAYVQSATRASPSMVVTRSAYMKGAAAPMQAGFAKVQGARQDVESFSTASSSSQQGTILAFAGFILAAASAFLVHQQDSKSKPLSAWAMTAVEADAVEAEDEDEEEDEEIKLLPTEEQLMAAKQELLRLQGKGAGSLASGEILRPVSFPGEEGLVNLVDLYKQFDEMLGGEEQSLAIGTKVLGTVFDITDRGASVDFGGKTIGFCPLEELNMVKPDHPSQVVEIGQQREFQIIAPATGRRRDEDEFVLLSMRAIAEEVAWGWFKTLKEYKRQVDEETGVMEPEVAVNMVITGKNRGGYTVEFPYFPVPGFLPKSQATSDLATAPETAEPSTYMGREIMVGILDLDVERRRLVVSQRMVTPKFEAEMYKTGTVHEGTVQNVKPYGVFVDINGMNGLLHISQISHNRIDNVETVFKVGDKIKCMVLSQDQVQGRLALTTKRLEPTHGDMLTNPQLVYEKAEEMAQRFRDDIAAAEKRMQEFEAKLAEQNTVAFG